MNKPTFLAVLLLLISTINTWSDTVIRMEEQNGIYRIPCLVNGAKMKFVFDTGASSVSISLPLAEYMLDNELISVDDITGTGSTMVADGRIVDHVKINLRDIQIGDLHLNNVECIVLEKQDAPLLLGQSAIKKLGTYEINGSLLIIHNNNGNKSADDYVKDILEKAYNAYAIEMYEKAIELYESVYGTEQFDDIEKYQYAKCLFEVKKYDKALSVLNSINKIYPIYRIKFFRLNSDDIYITMNEQDTQWLYGKMRSKGINTGTYNDFKRSLSLKEDRDWYYEKSQEFGLDVGTQKEFDESFHVCDRREAIGIYRQKLFRAINDAGFDIGDYAEFDRRMNNADDRSKFYNAVQNAGFDIGNFVEFDRLISYTEDTTALDTIYIYDKRELDEEALSFLKRRTDIIESLKNPCTNLSDNQTVSLFSHGIDYAILSRYDEGYKLYGDCYYEKKEYDKAIRYFKQQLNAPCYKGSSWDLYYDLAFCYYNKEDWITANFYFRESLNLFAESCGVTIDYLYKDCRNQLAAGKKSYRDTNIDHIIYMYVLTCEHSGKFSTEEFYKEMNSLAQANNRHAQQYIRNNK